MKIIEFLGMPRAGKTTQIKLLKKYLTKNGYSVTVVTDRERAKRLHTPPTAGLDYTLTFFAEAIEATHKFKTDFLLIDRGPNDVAVWADVRLAFKEITKKENEALKNIFNRFTKFIDHTFYFEHPIEDSLTRHGKDEAVDKVAMNNKWLTVLQKSYQKNAKNFRKKVTIDGSKEIDNVHKTIIRTLGV